MVAAKKPRIEQGFVAIVIFYFKKLSLKMLPFQEFGSYIQKLSLQIYI